jgi:cephalosporin hydroxylase
MPFMEECLDWPLSRVLPLLQQQIRERSKYHGVPTLKSPMDFWIYKEILWETQPEFIIEIGNFRGGSALALAHACDAIDKGKIIGIDTTHADVYPNVRAHPRITLLTGTACDMYSAVEPMLEDSRNVMVIEDSAHTYENTLKVLETYAPLIGTGHYFIVEDGICHHGLDMGPDPGPYEAVEAFLKTNRNFMLDRTREGYCITWNPKGYLKRIAAP